MMIVKAIHLKDGIPQISEYGIINEHFNDNKTISMDEYFASGLARRVYEDVSNTLWPFFLTHLIHPDDQELVYPTLAKMVRKHQRKTERNQIIEVCSIMDKVNPRYHG